VTTDEHCAAKMADDTNSRRRAGWPASVYSHADPAWIGYLHDIYYLAGMLYVLGKGDAAIFALADAAKDTPAGLVTANPPDPQFLHVPEDRRSFRFHS
jgi:hypothetical protein